MSFQSENGNGKPKNINMQKKSAQKSISLCIIGKPNAGKSSLLNQMIGQKISIVTPKVQTTRSIITGVITIDDTQVIIFDTPGIFEPKKQLERAMVRCAWSSLHGADLVMLIIDSTKPLDEDVLRIINKLKLLNINPVFLLNKTDLKSKQIEQITTQLLNNVENAVIFNISALLGEGMSKLLNYIISKAKNTPWLYEEDDLTNLPMRFLASEITREQLFLNLHQELPYNLTVQTEFWHDNPDGSVKINQIIVVSKENYKIMILGKRGAKIKEIGSNARLEIEKLLGCKVHLFLFVKVRELWENTPEFYHYMGLKFEKPK